MEYSKLFLTVTLGLIGVFGIAQVLLLLSERCHEPPPPSEFVGLDEDTFLCTRTARSRLVCSNGQEKFAITTFDLGGKAWNGSPRRER
jgi:hypothetical protein